MKASYLLKTNIDKLLQARHQSQHDLAQWCRRSDAWLSKILGKDNRNIPLAYLDRIADFFGIATYQLFQPGISPLTERRKTADRRSGADRRVSALNSQVRESVAATIATLTAEDVADLIRLRTLGGESRAEVRRSMHALERSAPRSDRPKRARRVAETPSDGPTAPSVHGVRRRRGSAAE